MTKPLSMILSVHRYTQDKFTPVFDLTYSLNTWSFFNCQKYLFIVVHVHGQEVLHYYIFVYMTRPWQAMHGVHDFIQREGEGSIDPA